MFDPSKLNLEIDENKDMPEKKEQDKKTELNSLENKTIQDNSEAINKTNEANDDILANLTISEDKNNVIDIEKKEDNIIQELNDDAIINDSIYTKNEEKTEEINTEKKENKPFIDEVIEEKITTANIINVEKVIYDINITKLDDIFYLLVDKEYDFVTLEPSDNDVKIEFRKNKVVVDTRFIKFPTYSNILVKAKTSTKLKVDENQKTQEGFGEIAIRNKNFKVISKTVPSDIGEKLFLKLKTQEKKAVKKVQKKMSISQIFTFLGTIAFIGLLIGGSFIGFIALNAKTIEDVKFFAGLGIDLNEINSFISQIITIIFSILLLFETIFLIIFLFKFSLTKKEFKKKKIKFGILSALFFIITFSTFSAWMVIDQKISSLPNWQEVALGEVQVFDNSKLTSEQFDKVGSQITDTSNLIGPIEIKFDLSYYAKNQEAKGVSIKKFAWYFGNDDPIETPLPTIIRNFDTKGNHEIKLMITEVDIQGNIIEKEVEGIPSINLAYVVDIEERILSNGGKQVDFDASSLGELGKIEWYFIDSLDAPEWEGEKYIISRPIFDETLVGMYIRRNDKESETLDKIFIIQGQEKVNIQGQIDYIRDIINDLEFTFNVKNISNDVGSGFIENFVWSIGDNEYTKQGDIDDPEKSSEITHVFDSYGEKTIKVVLTDSSGETKTITEKINIPKILNLSRGLNIYSDGELIEDIEYNPALHEYFINNLGIPNEMKLDARLVKADSTLYSLDDVEWDYNGDGDIDDTGRIGYHEINTEGNHNIEVKFTFVNKKIPTDTIEIIEDLFIETIRKEAIIDFEINKESNYVPVTIGFDASKSQVKDSNIAKFIWDYGDGISEERDSIVPGHKYSEAGDYTVTLSVVTDEGKKYTTTKDLILKPKPQDININASMKNAPTYQGIDFSSAGSEGQISSYFWDFGDGNNSTEANPTHSYEKEGEYEVSLRIDFSNKNTLEKSIDITIYED